MTLATPAADTIEVSRLSWEMKEFELHYLRRLVNNLLVDDVVAARLAKRRRQEFLAARERAFREPSFRREMCATLELAELPPGT